ncbi:hypothetical protein MTBBW1_350038 [Desulfamplus magnetovallimortis]|uniref:Uncharacterized protein n=1 Tax=Desulfamplus magnetovallimortis TaxID=1246637 RepID=A0A1W1HGD2_9BACT|nr:hypothetical protein MTBBW1_350038 [Desulfamplus magnetovallimortis]
MGESIKKDYNYCCVSLNTSTDSDLIIAFIYSVVAVSRAMYVIRKKIGMEKNDIPRYNFKSFPAFCKKGTWTEFPC